MKFKIILPALIILAPTIYAQTGNSKIDKLISDGQFNSAKSKIEKTIDSGKLTETEIKKFQFEIERMNRIRLDFRKPREFVLDYIHKYIPNAKQTDLEKWENDGSIEFKIIDGEKKYFNRAHTNFFLINKRAKEIKDSIEGKKIKKSRIDGMKQIDQIIPSSKNHVLKLPTEMEINYTITVEPDAVPDGEIVKCWMPFPREDVNRQGDIILESVNSDNYTISPNDYKHRSLFIEKPAIKGKPTIFNYKLTFVSNAEYFDLNKMDIKSYKKNDSDYVKYTSERAPHIIFSDRIKKLSKSIIGEEKNPYKKAKLIFTWINQNIPWAGAREYSTLQNIPEYCLNTGHGDCGIKTLLFMTLCRYNGIPARWQSGWMLHPGSVNLHDWSEIYFEGVGWVPVDQSFGIQKFDDETKKYFYLGGIDSYRMIVNNDYSASFYPSKKHFRSETVDFQRGEVEWTGGNLYFDKWDYHMDVKYLNK